MTTDFTGPAADAAAQAERAATGPQDAILEKLVEKVGGRASVKAVFGDPITRNGKTVVPVAKIRWGFGGGSGQGTSPAEGVTGSRRFIYLTRNRCRHGRPQEKNFALEAQHAPQPPRAEGHDVSGMPELR